MTRRVVMVLATMLVLMPLARPASAKKYNQYELKELREERQARKDEKAELRQERQDDQDEQADHPRAHSAFGQKRGAYDDDDGDADDLDLGD